MLSKSTSVRSQLLFNPAHQNHHVSLYQVDAQQMTRCRGLVLSEALVGDHSYHSGNEAEYFQRFWVLEHADCNAREEAKVACSARKTKREKSISWFFSFLSPPFLFSLCLSPPFFLPLISPYPLHICFSLFSKICQYKFSKQTRSS